jgi:amidophosphoribosyltransferase
MRIGSPPIQWPCFYGIDTANRDELIGSSRSIEEIREFVGADSLGYLSVDGMLTSTGVPTERFCHACFSGGYPIEVPPETARTKHVLELPVRPGANGNGRAHAPEPVAADPLPGIPAE